MKPLSIECPNLTCIINQSQPEWVELKNYKSKRPPSFYYFEQNQIQRESYIEITKPMSKLEELHSSSSQNKPVMTFEF